MTRGAGARSAAQRRDHVETERLGRCAGLLRAVEHRDALHRGRQRGEERLDREGTVEPQLQDAHTLALGREVLRGRTRRDRTRAHHDDHAFRVGRTVVLDESVATPGQLREAVELRGDDRRATRMEHVAGLAGLEEGIGVLRSPAQDWGDPASARARGAPRPTTRRSSRGASSSGSSTIFCTSCDVRNPSKKCRNGTRERSVAAWPTSAMSCASCTDAEDSSAKPVCRQAITSEWSPKIESACVAIVRAATWMHERRELARDLVEVRHHQQQALRRRERRRERPAVSAPWRFPPPRLPTASRRRRARRPRGSRPLRPPTRPRARPSSTRA
jgi:hypothetical protein